MPIRPEWRRFYRGREWEAARNGELRRAGGQFDEKGKYTGGAKCRQCGKPDRTRVETVSFKNLVGDAIMLWREVGSSWWAWKDGRLQASTATDKFFGGTDWRRDLRLILVKIGVAHLDHNPANRFEYNLRALCQWCHLHYDAPHHKQSRATRKDGARPLLKAAAEWGRMFEGLRKVGS